MTLNQFLLATIACCAFTACTPKDAAEETAATDETAAVPDAGADEPATTAEEDMCNASEYQSLVGSNVAAVSLPADLVQRIYKQGDPITMDYRPDRLNIVTDADGVIIEVKCG